MSAFPHSFGLSATQGDNVYPWDNIDHLYPSGASNLPQNATIAQTNQLNGPNLQNADDAESGETLIINALEAMAASITEVRDMVGRNSKDIDTAELSKTIGNTVSSEVGEKVHEKLHKWEHHLGRHLLAEKKRSNQTEMMIRTLHIKQENDIKKMVEERMEKLLSDLEDRLKKIMGAYLPRKEFLHLLYGTEISEPEESMRVNEQYI